MNEKEEKMFYSLEELSKLLSISVSGIRNKIFRGEIPKYKVLGRVVVPVKWVKNMIKKACDNAQGINNNSNKEL